MMELKIFVRPRLSPKGPRFLSTLTSPSIASDLETDLSSSSLAPADSVSSSTSSATKLPSTVQPSTILDIASAIKESSAKSDFQSLFPEIPASFADVSSQNSPAVARPDMPYRNSSMRKGSELEESLRRSVYQRDPISTWWPLYEKVASQWRYRPRPLLSAVHDTVLTRTDFTRFIGALKVSSPSSRVSDQLTKLERIFEDFHMVIMTPKSNVKVYSAFLDTLHFWKLDDLIPGWIQRIKSKAMLPQTLSSTDLSLAPQSFQEQYHDLMRVLANTDQAEALLSCLEDLKAGHLDQLQPTTEAYDMLLEVYMKHKDTTAAMRIFQEMQELGLSPQLTTFNILLRGHLSNKDAQAAQRVLEMLLLTDIRPDIYTFNTLMSGYLNMGEIEVVNGFYKGLGEYGLVPNAKTYRILMKAHLRQGHVDRTIDLFSRMKESSRIELQPGPEEYHILVQALASHGRMPDALKVLREITESVKMPVTTPIYNVFVNQYAREGQVEKARRILDRIISEKLPLVDGSINPLIRAYLARSDFDKVEEMIQLMKRYGIHPTRATFNIMINSTKGSGNLSGAMKMYERMVADGVKPDVWTFNSLLDILVGKLTFSQDNNKRRRDSTVMIDQQIKKYLPQIEALLQDMKIAGIKPDIVTYSNLIRQYVALQDIEQAEMLFHEMLKSGISPNGYVFNTLMNGFTLIEQMDKALELFRRMPKYGVEPDVVTFTTLIKGYANTKQMTLAQDFANSLQQQSSKIIMDQYCLHTLMQLAQKSHQPGMALDFFEMMRGRGIEPDKVTFTILINSLSRGFAQIWSPSSKSKSESRGRNRKSGAGAAVGSDCSTTHTMANNPQAESAAEAIESLLEVVRQDQYPLHHSEITTVISAYCRLGRPIAAIEFFKTSFWKGNPNLSTTNCGALFVGLLAPEYKRRYDGVVLNLYLRMLGETKEMIRSEETRKRPTNDGAEVEPSPAEHKEQPQGITWTSKGFIKPSRSLSQEPSATRFSTQNLPPLDLITINILFQSFSKRNNWSIVRRLWEDLESIGAEKLYPFEMPREFLGWAAQAYHLAADREPSTADIVGGGGLRMSSPRETHDQKAERLLRRLWNEHQRMGVEWSKKIYGYNIFDAAAMSNSFPPPSPSPSSPSSLSAETNTTSSTKSSSLLSSYLSDDPDQRSYRMGVEDAEDAEKPKSGDENENKNKEER
ncbi:hypothetical protein BGZ54_000593 [Gamsiella multidivaricata]|nr:hypothetical protein BGZ54_000593 [Gamsiella multidivaricata]